MLIIEDSPDLADSLMDIINLSGYNALHAPDGRTGLSLALEKKPGLILLDLRLPDIDGIEVMRRIRKDDWGKDVKILILTASDFTEKTVPELNIDPENIIYKSHLGARALSERLTKEFEKISRKKFSNY